MVPAAALTWPHLPTDPLPPGEIRAVWGLRFLQEGGRGEMGGGAGAIRPRVKLGEGKARQKQELKMRSKSMPAGDAEGTEGEGNTRHN